MNSKSVLVIPYLAVAGIVESFFYSVNIPAAIIGLGLFGVVGMVIFLGKAKPKEKETDLTTEPSADTSPPPVQTLSGNPPPMRQGTETNSPFVGEQEALEVEVISDAKVRVGDLFDIRPKKVTLKTPTEQIEQKIEEKAAEEAPPFPQ